MSLPLNQVILGNCVEVMAEWPENSVDCIVTDPNYGIGFMGLDWDKALPPVAAFEQMIRVLKPGALAFVMSSPRQDVLWRMLSMLEGVGFQLRQSAIFWIYRTGFPKALDVSKGIDRKFGRLNQSVVEIKKKLKTIYKNSGKTLKQINQECGFEASGYIRIKGVPPWPQVLPSYEKWLKIKEVLNYQEDEITPLLDSWFKEAEREIIGEDRKWSCTFAESFKGIRREDTSYDITSPSTDLARQWEGWKSQTGLKPAAECILMVNKPRSEPTIVDNVLRWGTGAINVDACRIPILEKDRTSRPNVEGKRYEEGDHIYGKGLGYGVPMLSDKGRFPANLLISSGVLDRPGETSKSGKFEPHHKIAKDEKGHSVKNVYGKYRHLPADQQVFYGDEGSPYRFFDLDAWSEHHGFLDVAKPSRAERDFGLSGYVLRSDTPPSLVNEIKEYIHTS